MSTLRGAVLRVFPERSRSFREHGNRRPPERFPRFPWFPTVPGTAHLVRFATMYAEDSYSRLHHLLRLRFGSASERACYRCGRRARVWSCVASPADRVSGHDADGRAVTYSLNLADYRPACGPCGALDDRENAATRRATAHLAISPLPERPRRPRPARRPPAAAAAAPALFDLDPSDPDGWRMP